MTNKANSHKHLLAASGAMVFFALYGSSFSLTFAATASFMIAAVTVVAFYFTSFMLRMNGILYLPQLFYPESKKLKELIWSKKFQRVASDNELLSRLSKSYSQLPLILGERRKVPLLIPAKVDDALETLVDSFLKLNVSSWYLGRVSDKADFVEELRHSFACVIRSVYSDLLQTDIAGLVTKRIAPTFLKHICIAKTCKQNMQIPKYDLVNLEQSRRIMMCYKNGRRIHPALASAEDEALYLRALADVLLPLFCPGDLLAIQSSKVFLREALAAKLHQLINYLSSPVIVNKLLYLWACPGRKFPGHVSSWRLLLADYGWRRPRTTPLLCFSLQEITPQAEETPTPFNSRLLYAFQQFLRRRGSTYLDLYMLYQEIILGVLPVFSDARLLATDLSQSSQSVRRKLYSKICELHRTYIDPNEQRSPTCAETADEPVMGSDPFDTEAVELAENWKRIVEVGQDGLIDPDANLIFQRVKQHLENRLQPLIYEFNQCDLSLTVFKNISGAGSTSANPAPSRKKIVNELARTSYKFSTSSSSGKLRSNSDYSLSTVPPDADEMLPPLSAHPQGASLKVSPSSAGDRKSASPALSDLGVEQNTNNPQTFSPQSSLLQAEIPDLSTWRVSIPFVEFSPTNKLSVSGAPQAIPIYVVSIRRVDFVSNDESDEEAEIDDSNRFYMPGVFELRNDDVFRLSASSDENRRRSWNVRRYLDQFYLLEQKLKERYGDMIDSTLPARSRVFVLLREDRAYYEKRRRIFERFLQSLFEKSELRHSRLLYNFLTTDEGFNQRSPGEGSIGRKILRSVLVKSDSKPLDPFLNAFQQVCESSNIPQATTLTSRTRGGKRSKVESDNESIRSLNIGSFSTDAGLGDESNLFPSTPLQLFADNSASLLNGLDAEHCSIINFDQIPNSLFDLISSLAVDVISKKAHSNFQSFTCLIDPALSISSFFLKSSTEPLLQRKINDMLQATLGEEKVAGWIHTLNAALMEQQSSSPTWDDYLYGRDLAISTMIKDANVPHEMATLIVESLQEPIPNKQLLYTLLDAFVEEIYPALRDSKVSNN